VHSARLIAGTTTLHRQLERRLADFLHAEEAVVFNTGYITNLATIHALVGKDDCVIADEFSHTSLMDGCRFSGAQFLLFRCTTSIAMAIKALLGRLLSWQCIGSALPQAISLLWPSWVRG
jgi:7-keto-8-aminopelargonate synthetase-like enzyme